MWDLNPKGLQGAFELGATTRTNAVTSSALSHQGTASTPFAFGSTTSSVTQSAAGFSFIGGSAPQTGCTNFNIVLMGNASQPTAFAGLPLTPATRTSSGTIATQSITPFNRGGQSTKLVRFELCSLMGKHSIQD